MVIAAVVVVVVVTKPKFLGFKKVLDHTAVENTIRTQSGGQYRNVVCPSDEEVETGRTFRCTADGGRQVQVTVTSKSGDYQWAPVG